MEYVTKNYRENGDKTVIGGELAIIGAGKVTKDGSPVNIGGPAKATIPADSVATDVAGLKNDLNALLAALRAANS
jgi:hypothetical protein